MKSKVSIVRCEDYSIENVRIAVKKTLENLGGLENFIKPNQRVLVKPNLLSAKDPSRAITTHPAIVQSVIEEIKKFGAVPSIGDSPGGAERGVGRVWENTKMCEVAENTGTELVKFEGGGVCRAETPDGKIYYVSKYALQVDAIVSLPKMKTHVLVLFTGAIKNMFGIIPGFRKSEYHKRFPHPMDFSQMLVDVFSLALPKLSIMDAIVCMDGDGPSSGNPKYVGLILASSDAVALDKVCSGIYGFKENEIETTSIAEKRGLGTANVSNIEIVGEKLSDVVLPKFDLPSNRFLKIIPKFMVKLLEPYFWIRPNIKEELCTNCNICVENCPMKAIKENPKNPTFNHTKCINCLCCHELCPQNAVYLERSWLAKKFVH